MTTTVASTSRPVARLALLAGAWLLGAAPSLTSAQPPAPVPLFTWGEAAAGEPGVFGFPTGIAIDDATGDIWVVDRNYGRASRFDQNGNFILEFSCRGCLGIEVNPLTRRVFVASVTSDTVEEWTVDGSFVRTIGGPGAGDGQFNDPRNLAIDVDTGEVYVFDSLNTRIQVFDADGNYLRKWGGRGDGPGLFEGTNGPYSVAFDAMSRTVVATDPRVNNVHRFTPQGEVLDFWALPRSFGRGETRWIRDVEIDLNGDVMLADSDNERIQVFGADAQPTALFRGPHDPVTGAFHPRSIAVNRTTGRRYVMAAYSHRVDVFSADNQYEFSFGGQPDAGLTLNRPTTIAVMPGSGDVIVVDEKNNLMKRFTGDGAFVAEWGVSSRIAATVERTGGPIMPFDGSAIAIDVDGVIYHAKSGTYYGDAGEKYLQKIDGNSGRLLDAWPTLIENNNTRTGVALDEVGGRVFVSEPKESLVAVYDTAGELITSIEVDNPAGLAWGATGLYVASTACHCIRRYSADLTFELQFGERGPAEGQLDLASLSQIALDPYGVLYVADTGNDRLQGFDADGNFLFAFGSRGNGFGEFNAPIGVAVDAAADRLYVTDEENNRVYAFDLGRRD